VKARITSITTTTPVAERAPSAPKTMFVLTMRRYCEPNVVDMYTRRLLRVTVSGFAQAPSRCAPASACSTT
jgi:hypothetical protein